MAIPMWLLDIDGVINALADEPPASVWPADQWITTTARSAGDLEWPLQAARPVLDFLREVHRSGRAEIRWHTGWQHYAGNVSAALDLPAWPILDCPEYASAPLGVPLTEAAEPWWKLPAAQRVADSGRALLWTDDDALRQGAAIEGALIIAPDEETGLTPSQLRLIDTWLNARGIAI
ncbi:hypothetical protein [Hamadaea tsunoensis]|uniref:hypothetical protein n=1 Tax=Hamadaea tsunoensis TaxID=53368 RepID=UPI00041C3AAE|nr:hypothetical protein [Hamadaea tsunoensis]